MSTLAKRTSHPWRVWVRPLLRRRRCPQCRRSGVTCFSACEPVNRGTMQRITTHY